MYAKDFLDGCHFGTYMDDFFMVDIIDLALQGRDHVPFDGGFRTSNNVGIAFQMSLFLFCFFFVHELKIFKVLEHN